MNQVLVRPMVEADLSRVVAIEAAAQPSPWTRERFAAELALPQSRLSVAESSSEVVGYLSAWVVAGEIEIQNVVTAPEQRRRGVAAALLDEVLDFAQLHAVERLLLEVRSDNRGAIALYRRFGFGECGLRRGYYADGDDALLMEKLLA